MITKKIITKGLKYYTVLFLTVNLVSSCAKDSSPTTDTSSENGSGGSVARFTIVDDRLYTINSQTLKTFNISDEENPYFENEADIGFGIETIFPYEGKLIIGSQTGIYIFDLTNPDIPQKISQYEHIYACDPVVAKDSFAYVTLHSNDSWCGRTIDELQIIDLHDIYNLKRVKRYPMTNPLGLGTADTLLFVCDNGLKIYDISDTPEIVLIDFFSINAVDVIPNDNMLFVIGEDGFYQFTYFDNKLTLVSKLLIDIE